MPDNDFDEQVAFVTKMIRDWLNNLARDAYATGAVLDASVISQALEQLKEEYDEIWQEHDFDAWLKYLSDE